MMVSVPPASPVTIPVPGPTVAIAVLMLLQEPPAVGSLKVNGVPAQAVLPPVIAAGTGTTVIVFVTVQPVPSE